MKYKNTKLPGYFSLAYIVTVFVLYSSGVNSEELSTQNSLQENSQSLYLYITIIALSLSTLISVGISFYLYKWRKVILSNPSSVVPEQWAKYLKTAGQNIETLSGIVDRRISSLAKETNNNSDRITSMTKTYMELQSALDSKDKEIARLKSGYDAEIFRKFISRFTRVDQAIDDFMLEGNESAELDLLKRLLADALEECGVEKYSPELGVDYRSAVGVADNPKTKITKDPEQEFLIAEVIAAGYQLNTGASVKNLIPSKVKIYKYEGAE